MLVALAFSKSGFVENVKLTAFLQHAIELVFKEIPIAEAIPVLGEPVVGRVDNDEIDRIIRGRCQVGVTIGEVDGDEIHFFGLLVISKLILLSYSILVSLI